MVNLLDINKFININMTPNFDKFCQKVINEYETAKSKRRNSRYWNPNNPTLSATPRKVKNMTSRSPSQHVKIDHDQQYVGNVWDMNGIRKQNISRKEGPRAGIAKGLGNHITIDGINPKEPGSAVNSKQGNMEVKYTMGNGVSKIGATGKKDYFTGSTNRKFLKNKE